MSDRVAFYGTLRSTAPPLPGAPRLEALVRVLGPCVLPGTLHDVGSYPALVPHPAARVQGELCEVLDPAALAVLDAWEDYRPEDEAGSEYVRRRVRLLDPDEEAWTYVLNRPPGELPAIAGGDWVAHVAARGGLPGARRWAPSSG